MPPKATYTEANFNALLDEYSKLRGERDEALLLLCSLATCETQVQYTSVIERLKAFVLKINPPKNAQNTLPAPSSSHR